MCFDAGMATRGERAENLSRRTSSKGGVEMANGVGVPLKLTPVLFIEGDEKERLGELDLNQLDSFRSVLNPPPPPRAPSPPTKFFTTTTT